MLQLRKLHRENTVQADDPLRFVGDQCIGAEVLLSVRATAVYHFLNMHDLIICNNKTSWTYTETNLVSFTMTIRAYKSLNTQCVVFALCCDNFPSNSAECVAVIHAYRGPIYSNRFSDSFSRLTMANVYRIFL